MTKRVAIFISGGGSNMIRLLDSMTGDHPARVCVVLSNNPKAGGLERAEERGVPTEIVRHQPFGADTSGFEHAILGALAEHKPDIICLAGFMRILTAEFVNRWRGKMLNIHPSLLPKYKGLHTHARALAAGDTVHGCTVHEVTPALDDGPILGQARVPVLAGDTAETLAARVLVQEHILYPMVLRRFVGGDTAPVFLDG
ncbi:phosphoribosylglycinamide formyltransferase [Roseobacter denitrificans]|uniref:Phosphoribosylglycinamide formyltransferase n=2 Tax=Roseobacter denitrificans TaxID=2434 RepID=Q167K3_ROSDO|nr:phosphoribosylglycinamide formyltransferase [Roseobacter denitrificans]ABG31840.1 phosphoribosylglycinamide formyltransferase putative [Roseobacter denitrificans OCh 114]AVL51399.1 phosphoribosylglycinamide formyltransferase [Roseobacter denitrificans]